MKHLFSPFPALGFPGARVVAHKRGAFPAFQKALLATGAALPINISVPAMSGIWGVLAGGLCNPKASPAAINLQARAAGAGGTIIGLATLQTDQTDNDATVVSVAANTPAFFHLLFWPTTDDKLSCMGWTMGGVIAAFVTIGNSGLATAPNGSLNPYVRPVTTINADVVSGPVDLALIGVTATSAAFTLDFVTVYEYPDVTEMWY